MGLNRNPHFPLTAQRRLNRNQGCQETLQIPCFFDDFSSTTFLNLFLFPFLHIALACKLTFYLHDSTYCTTSLERLLCSRLGKAEKTAPRCQKSALCSCPVSPACCRTSGSLSYLPGGPKLTQIGPISGRSGLSWAPLGSPGVPSGVALGLPCASLGSPGLSWLPLGPPGGSICASLRLDLKLLGSI